MGNHYFNILCHVKLTVRLRNCAVKGITKEMRKKLKYNVYLIAEQDFRGNGNVITRGNIYL